MASASWVPVNAKSRMSGTCKMYRLLMRCSAWSLTLSEIPCNIREQPRNVSLGFWHRKHLRQRTRSSIVETSCLSKLPFHSIVLSESSSDTRKCSTRSWHFSSGGSYTGKVLVFTPKMDDDDDRCFEGVQNNTKLKILSPWEIAVINTTMIWEIAVVRTVPFLVHVLVFSSQSFAV